jgi:hypothetical protein
MRKRGGDDVEEDDELETAGAMMWKPEFMGDQSEVDEFMSKAADAGCGAKEGSMDRSFASHH